MNLIARKRGGQALAAVPLRVGRLFDRLLDPWSLTPEGETWFPPMDVLETAEGLEVLVDLPGIDPKDVNISVQEDRLEISGSRPAPEFPDEARWYRFERHGGEFRRSLTLPAPVDTDRAEATTHHGQLRISLPKVAEVMPKRIAIKGS